MPSYHYSDFLDWALDNAALRLWSSLQNSTVITNWLTVTKYPFLKWQWLFSLLRGIFAKELFLSLGLCHLLIFHIFIFFSTQEPLNQTWVRSYDIAVYDGPLGDLALYPRWLPRLLIGWKIGNIWKSFSSEPLDGMKPNLVQIVSKMVATADYSTFDFLALSQVSYIRFN